MTIAVGTASWTDPTLIASKRFYPNGCTSAEARLRFYASQFPLVEVDSSYYAMPSASNSVLWVERTPPHFTFNIKAFRLFTGHQTDRTKLPKDIQAALPPSDKKNLYYKDTPGRDPSRTVAAIHRGYRAAQAFGKARRSPFSVCAVGRE